MARRSQTELAVLGALSTAPMSGYELRAAISEVLGHFWHESYGQIYPCLAALEEAAMVRRTGPGRTSGTVMEITDAGEARLRQLLAEPHTVAPARNGLLLRLFFGTHLPEGGAEALLREAAAGAREALDGYAGVREDIAGDDGPEQTLRTITLSFGEHMARARLAWAQESLATLEASGGARARG